MEAPEEPAVMNIGYLCRGEYTDRSFVVIYLASAKGKLSLGTKVLDFLI